MKIGVKQGKYLPFWQLFIQSSPRGKEKRIHITFRNQYFKRKTVLGYSSFFTAIIPRLLFRYEVDAKMIRILT